MAGDLKGIPFRAGMVDHPAGGGVEASVDSEVGPLTRKEMNVRGYVDVVGNTSFDAVEQEVRDEMGRKNLSQVVVVYNMAKKRADIYVPKEAFREDME